MSRYLISVGFPAALRRPKQVELLPIPARFLPCRCSGAAARAATSGASVLRGPPSRAPLPVPGHPSPSRAPLPVPGPLSPRPGPSPRARPRSRAALGLRVPQRCPRLPQAPGPQRPRRCGSSGPCPGEDAGPGAEGEEQEQERAGRQARVTAQFAEMLLQLFLMGKVSCPERSSDSALGCSARRGCRGLEPRRGEYSTSSSGPRRGSARSPSGPGSVLLRASLGEGCRLCRLGGGGLWFWNLTVFTCCGEKGPESGGNCGARPPLPPQNRGRRSGASRVPRGSAGPQSSPG